MVASLLPVFHWLNNTALAAGIRESVWWYPILESVHSVGIILVLGSIWTLDLRLLGLGMRSQPVSQVAGRMLPWTWGGFACQAVSGSLLTASEATRLYPIVYFWIKMGLLLLAALNAMVFPWGVYRKVLQWDDAAVTPLRAKVAGAISLTLWIGIIAAGRAIGYVL